MSTGNGFHDTQLQIDFTLLSTLGILKGNFPVESPRATTRLLIDENENLLRNQCQIELQGILPDISI